MPIVLQELQCLAMKFKARSVLILEPILIAIFTITYFNKCITKLTNRTSGFVSRSFENLKVLVKTSIREPNLKQNSKFAIIYRSKLPIIAHFISLDDLYPSFLRVKQGFHLLVSFQHRHYTYQMTNLLKITLRSCISESRKLYVVPSCC